MSFHRLMAGVLLVGGVAYVGYLMDIPRMVILGLSIVLAICCILSGL